MAISIFGVRFGNIDVDNLTDEQLLLNDEIVTMVNMVRRISVVIKKAKIKEIVEVITTHSDPEIGLIISAAKNKDATYMFATDEQVRDLMFASTNRFQDGIRRVSAALAASVLIQALATLPEQREHAEVVIKRAIEELDRLLSLPDIATAVSAANNGENDNSDQRIVRLFFEKAEFSIPSNTFLRCNIYLSGYSEIDIYFFYKTTTRRILEVISDRINLAITASSLVCAPQLSYKPEIYALEFYLKKQVYGLLSEVITINFEYLKTSLSVPAAYSQSFTAASLISGVLTITHGLNHMITNIRIIDNLNNVISADSYITVGKDRVVIDLTSSLPIIGTWTAILDY